MLRSALLRVPTWRSWSAKCTSLPSASLLSSPARSTEWARLLAVLDVWQRRSPPAVPQLAGRPALRLSKAKKRQARAEARVTLKRERRHERRQHKQEVANRATAERMAHLQEMSPEDRAAFDLAEEVRRRADVLAWEEQQSRVEHALTHGVRVAIDLSYGAEMDVEAQKSLGRQLERCWGSNRRAAAPLALHLASVGDCPERCVPAGARQGAGWRVHLLEHDVSRHFAREELVFLSPDAPTALHGPLDRSKVYVVGGLVDRTVRSGCSLARAEALGAATARLPLAEVVASSPAVAASASTPPPTTTLDAGAGAGAGAQARAGLAHANPREPLTLNTVLDILLRVHAGEGWGDALAAELPARKQRPPRPRKPPRLRTTRFPVAARGHGTRELE